MYYRTYRPTYGAGMRHSKRGMFKSGGILLPAVMLGVGFTLGAGLTKAAVKMGNKFAGGKLPSEFASSFRANRNWYLYDYSQP